MIDIRTFRKRDFGLVLVTGTILTILSGLIKNNPGIGVPETNYFGYPLPWLMSHTFQNLEIILSNFLIDLLFWTIISLVFTLFLYKFKFPIQQYLVLIALIILSGLFMDLIHELGHLFWGLIVNGKLQYFKIAYLELYPNIQFVSDFSLGRALLNGFETNFNEAIYLLGGSLTTNIFSWAFSFFKNKNVLIKISGIFGLLDLPLYVFLPQLGLRHWILIGGNNPEPLLASRMIGIPDALFYLIVLISTILLIYMYSTKKTPIFLLEKIN